MAAAGTAADEGDSTESNASRAAASPWQDTASPSTAVGIAASPTIVGAASGAAVGAAVAAADSILRRCSSFLDVQSPRDLLQNQRKEFLRSQLRERMRRKKKKQI